MGNIQMSSNRKKINMAVIIILFSAVLFANGRVKYNFNPQWKVLVGDPKGAQSADFDDSNWKEVTMPYAWNENEAFERDIHHLSTGIAWYRKNFKIPASQEAQKIFIEFEGIRQAGEFYLNGTFIGRHENGVMAFGFDITYLVKPPPEENVIVVRIDNDWKYKEKYTDALFQWNNNNFNANYGGIPKNVWLHVTDKLYQTLPLYSTLGTTGVYVYARDIDVPAHQAKIMAESEVRNEYPYAMTFQYEVIIEDMNGDTIKTIDGGPALAAPHGTITVKAGAVVEGLHFWSWGYGYLYTVYTVLKVDRLPVDIVKTRTGFRKTEFANGMIKLNDRVMMIKGYAQRSSNEWPAVGMSVPPWLSDFSNRMIVEGNGNLVRWMHVTPWKQDVESCDRVGLIQAMPAGDAEKDAQGRQWEQRVELMRDAIIYNRNNPSILFYEGGNKGISESHMRELKRIRDNYDPYGGRAMGCRGMLGSEAAEYGGEMLYINKSADIPMWAMEYSRDEGLRKYWDSDSPPYHKDGDGPLYRNKPANEYNRNQDSHGIEDIRRWADYWRERPGTGRRVSSGGVNIIFSDTNTHFRGAENYRRSGEVDPMRIPKDNYYCNQVMWDGWVEIEKPRIHIMGHWNYKVGTKKNVYIVSSADRVELFVNGQSKGFGEKQYRFLYTFKGIEFEPGIIKAVGYDTTGKQLCSALKKTIGEPRRIKLTLHTAPEGLLASGADLALIDVEVVDKNGDRNPIAFNSIDFKLEGPAEWRGGIAQGKSNYILSRSLPVELGINRVLIRSTEEPGLIKLSASSKGLQSATVMIESIPVPVNDGLSETMPGDDLPSFLERGPTPPGPSFYITRIPVKIIDATAGVNSDQVRCSYDDNEMTQWSNDNRIKTGWVRYELERSANISEVTLKLNNWRRRAYPIRVSIDGKNAFTGVTEKTLGYTTLSFDTIKGKHLKIELTGTHIDKDAFMIEELDPSKQAAEIAMREREGKGMLSIIEIEVYQDTVDKNFESE
jgi:beta-galactosidase